MSALELPARGHGLGAGARIWRTVRLQFANPWTLLWTPWLILAVIFAGNLIVWYAIAIGTGTFDMKGTEYSGSAFFLFVYMLVLAIQAINLTFSFALGIGSTRRDYYLGSALAWAMVAAAFAIAMTILGFVETATGGWGVRATFFNTVYFGSSAPAARSFTIFAGMIFFSAIGAFLGSVFVRWGRVGLLSLGGYATIAAIVAVAWLSIAHGWAGVWHWVFTVGATGMMAWSLIPTVVFGVLGYLVIRRATPRN